ncbi:hypothetical protein MTQ01_13070 [Streptomyces sp. XM4193]|uniref:hypothetical protein n=1 Tax=Streptomyces sp. XM4193 TaxID=2929782 RepID=UPI001FF7E906|nr:hypothetical protein [Streptomyces sp. XM4193]MCK1796928.1 hypothetical protein [Streptomyces sp. XM4193]
MPDVTALATAVDRLADRVRALPQSALRRGAAEAAYALSCELARWAQQLEEPGTVPRPLPRVGEFTAGDQLAVVGHDLAAVLAERGAPGDPARALALLDEHAAALR